MSRSLFIRFFDESGPAPLEELGGKCASLVALTNAGMPVPPGFAATACLRDFFGAALPLATPCARGRRAQRPSHRTSPPERGGSARCGATRVRVLKTDLRNQG